MEPTKISEYTKVKKVEEKGKAKKMIQITEECDV